MTRRPLRSPLAVAAAGTAVVIVIVLRLLAVTGWDPVSFVAFGEDSTEINDLARDRLGRDELPVRVDQGHDGKFFFVQALDPLYLDPSTAAEYLDGPRYRAQRMLYPLVASLGGALPARAIPWSMLVVNVMFIAIGTAACARVARSMGGNPWWGLVFALNPGTVFELLIGGAGVLAFALAMVGLAGLLEGGLAGPALAFVGSALSREAMLLFIAGIAFLMWRRRGFRRAAAIAVPPLVSVLAWAGYLWIRLPVGEQPVFLAAPFTGIAKAAAQWHTPDLVGVAVLLVASVLVVWRAVDRPTYLGWGAVGFVALGIVLSGAVWTRFFDVYRALIPVLPAYLLVAFLPGEESARPRVKAGTG